MKINEHLFTKGKKSKITNILVKMEHGFRGNIDKVSEHQNILPKENISR